MDGLAFEKPRTKEFVGVLKNLKIERSCLVATSDYQENVYRSARNVGKVAVMPVADLNAGEIVKHQKVLFTKDALVSFLDRTGEGDN